MLLLFMVLIWGLEGGQWEQTKPNQQPRKDTSHQPNINGFAAQSRHPRLRLDPALVPVFTGALLKFRLSSSCPLARKAASKILLFCCHVKRRFTMSFFICLSSRRAGCDAWFPAEPRCRAEQPRTALASGGFKWCSLVPGLPAPLPQLCHHLLAAPTQGAMYEDTPSWRGAGMGELLKERSAWCNLPSFHRALTDQF